MNTLFIGQKIISPEQTDSTNSFMLRLLEKENIYEGTVVITRKQEHGRGQRGASWESELDKNLTLSIFLRPVFLKPDEQFFLNKVISLGVAEFITSLLAPISPHPTSPPATLQKERGVRMGEKGGEVKIKWPNDIYIGNRKVAGLLIENSVSGNQLQYSIAGIGININQKKFSSWIPNPTSLKIVTGKEFDLDQYFSVLCFCIEKRYLELRANHLSEIDNDYLKNLCRFGEWASYIYRGEKLKAKITGVTKIGKLILEKENGESLECDFSTRGGSAYGGKEVEFC